jgi:hypothetical protein
VLVTLAATACARSSPQLPPDLSHLPAEQRLLPGDLESPEAKLDCTALKQEAESTKASVKTYEAAIAANRGHNQGVGYFSAVLFPPLALAIRNDEEAKKSLDQLQAKADRLDRLIKAKGCETDRARSR